MFKFGVAATLLWASAAYAQPLTFSQALEKARANEPGLAGRNAQLRAARSAADAADALPDPKLDLALQNVPVTRGEAFSLTRDFMTMRSVGVTQDFPNLAKRHARLGRAQADIAAAQAGAAVTAKDVRTATALAWVDLYFAERRLAILGLLDRSIDDIAGTAAARVASGSARPSQGLEPKQLKANVADRRDEIAVEIARAKAELNRWTGDPDPSATGAPPDWAIDPDRLAAQIDGLPELQALDAATAQADADARLARAEKRPDFSVSLSYGNREPSFSDMVSVGFSIGLPLFAKHRQDPIIAARAEQANAARLARAGVERELRAKLLGDLAEHRSHHEKYRRTRDVLVPLAVERAKLDQASYAAGRIDLGTALGMTVAVANAEIDELDREAMVVRDGIRINLTYGNTPQ